MPFRILIVDDHPLIRWALQQLISREPDFEVCATVATASAAVEAIAEHGPDLVVLDILLEDGDGVQVIHYANSLSRPPRILVSSMCENPSRVGDIVARGVAGFVDKGQTMEYLLQAMRSVLKGANVVSPKIQQLCVDALRRGVPAEGGLALPSLSKRESEVFRLMGERLNPQEIADQLGISLKTVHTHRQNIRQKLGLRSMADLTGKVAVWATSLA